MKKCDKLNSRKQQHYKCI